MPILTSLTLCPLSEAHPSQQNAMWVQFEPSQVHLALNVSLKELAAVWGIALPEESSTDPSSMLWAAQQHTSYIQEHLHLFEETTRLTGSVLKVTPPANFGDPEGTYFQYELEYPFSGPPPKALSISQDMLKEWPYAPGVPWDISYIIRAKRSDDETVSSWLLRFQTPTELPTGWGAAPSELPTEGLGKKAIPESPMWEKVLGKLRRFLRL